MAVILPQPQDVVLDTGLNYYVENFTGTRLTQADGKTDLLRYNRVVYRCEAGEKVIVPWAVIALYFGDPRSQPDKIVEAEDSQGKHRVPARGNELLRLSVFYGVYEQGVDVLSTVVPDVRITTLAGVEIIPPVFDPECEFQYGFQKSTQRSEDVATMIQNLQEQVDALKSQQAAMRINGDNDRAIPEDNPGMP